MAKYKNDKINVEGIEFSSKFEANCFKYLKQLENQNIIKGLKTQPIFSLQNSFYCPYYDGKNKKVNKTKHRETNYISDFKFDYLYHGTWYQTVLETKGFIDQKYPIKKKLFLYQYGKDNIFLEIHRVGEFKIIPELIEEIIKLKETKA